MWVGVAIENATSAGLCILCHVYKVVSRLSFKLRSVTRVTLRWTGREHARFVGRRVWAIHFSARPWGRKRFRRPSRPKPRADVGAALSTHALSNSVGCALWPLGQISRETLRLGPAPLDEGAIRSRRFATTNLAAALCNSRGKHVLIAAGASLYSALADLALRAANQWSASGKGIFTGSYCI